MSNKLLLICLIIFEIVKPKRCFEFIFELSYSTTIHGIVICHSCVLFCTEETSPNIKVFRFTCVYKIRIVCIKRNTISWYCCYRCVFKMLTEILYPRYCTRNRSCLRRVKHCPANLLLCYIWPLAWGDIAKKILAGCFYVKINHCLGSSHVLRGTEQSMQQK